jgi:hypothetical protein
MNPGGVNLCHWSELVMSERYIDQSKDPNLKDIRLAYEIMKVQAENELEWFVCMIKAVLELERQFLAGRHQLSTHTAKDTLDHHFFETLWKFKLATPGDPVIVKQPDKDSDPLYYFPPSNVSRFDYWERDPTAPADGNWSI